jgi:hypothetical protein
LVGRLVQGVEGEPAAGVGDGRLPLPPGGEAAREPLQRAGKLAPQALALEELPVVEGHAVAQAEARHKIVPVQRRRPRQRRQALGADLRLRVAVHTALDEPGVEAVHVHHDVLAGELHPLPVYAQPARGARLLERREGPAQGGPRPGLVVLGPQQPRERVARVAPPRDGQVGDQRYRLARVHLDRNPVVHHARRAEQRYRRPGHDHPDVC